MKALAAPGLGSLSPLAAAAPETGDFLTAGESRSQQKNKENIWSCGNHQDNAMSTRSTINSLTFLNLNTELTFNCL